MIRILHSKFQIPSPINSGFGLHRRFATVPEDELNKCFSTLGLNPDSDQEQVRSTFINLAKKFHPDSGSPESDVEKFREIEVAYRKIQEEFAHRRWNVNEGAGEYGLYYEDKDGDDDQSKFKVAQHRQFLNYDGMGTGNPFQRLKQFDSYRAAKASSHVTDYKLRKIEGNLTGNAVMSKTRQKHKNAKTGIGIDRLVEDLIQESMAKGEFDNLSGSGKPLQTKRHFDNPYVDFVTHKMNQVLIDNGFKPSWISIQQDIASRSKGIRSKLGREREKLGPKPLSTDEQASWEYTLKDLEEEVKYLNSRINSYNLIVPLIEKQMLQFNLEREADTVLRDGPSRQAQKSTPVPEEPEKGSFKEALFKLGGLCFSKAKE